MNPRTFNRPSMGLDGPAREITVEPVEVPQREPERVPEREPERVPDRPVKEPDKVPA